VAGPQLSRLRHLLLGLVALLVAAVVAALVVAHSEGSSANGALPNGRLLTATADLFPQSLLFAQPVHVVVDAVVDNRKLDPRGVRLDANWSPYTPVAPVALTRSDVGGYSHLRWRVDLHCVELGCVPRVGSNVRNVFQPAVVRYVGRVRGGGSVDSVTVTWPNVIAWSRLDPVDQERKAVVRKTGSVAVRQNAAFGTTWHVNTALAAVSYRVAPNTLFWAALGAALLLMVATSVLLRPYLPGVLWRRTPPVQTRLERALAEVERARGKPVEERKALELLAVELRGSGEPGLAWAATELAWSSHVPEPQRTGALTEAIRRELAGRTNGHGS
jgi:hypothetical protein